MSDRRIEPAGSYGPGTLALRHNAIDPTFQHRPSQAVFPSSVRIAVALVLFVLGTFLLSFGRIEGIFMVLGALYWLFTYVRYGPVKVAFVAYRRGEMEKAEELVRGVRWPRLLAPRMRSYYFWILGAIAAHRGMLDEAHGWYERARDGRVRQESDRSVLEALLAEVEIGRGDTEGALRRIATARQLAHREDLDSFLDELEERASCVGRRP
jgi:hypothetical protein